MVVGEPLWWREEARKSRDYYRSDMEPNVMEPFDVEATSVMEDGYVDCYLKREIWLEVDFGVYVNGQLDLYLAIIEAPTTAPRNSSDWGIEDGSRGDEKLMFVRGREVIENGKGVNARQLPKVVRLKLLDDFLGFDRHLFDAMIERSLASPSRLLEYWEGHVVHGLWRGKSRQGPGEVVKSASHIVDNVANYDCPASRRLPMYSDPIDMSSLFHIIISS